jgi:hypothetical protein
MESRADTMADGSDEMLFCCFEMNALSCEIRFLVHEMDVGAF